MTSIAARGKVIPAADRAAARAAMQNFQAQRETAPPAALVNFACQVLSRAAGSGTRTCSAAASIISRRRGRRERSDAMLDGLALPF